MTDAPMTQDWICKSFREGDTESNPHGGQLQKFYVDFEGVDGTLRPDTYWRRKVVATGTAPEVGLPYYGTISKNQYGYMFKKEKAEGSFSGATGTSGTKEWVPENSRDPERGARILRQHSQEMAIRVLAARGLFELKDVGAIHGHLENWTDFFDEDVVKAGQKVIQGAGGTGPLASKGASGPGAHPSPAPASPPADDIGELYKLLEQAGLAFYPASKLGDFMMEKGSQESLTKAFTGLRDPMKATTTLSWLTRTYEAKEGEPLPAAAPGVSDDIPF